MATIANKIVNFALLCLTAGLVSCKRSHEEARHFETAKTELNVPAPVRDKALDQRLEWNLETFVDAYDKVGSHNKKWDFPAREALQIVAQQNSVGTWLKSSKSLLPFDLGKATDAGCDDPLLNYLHVRYVLIDTMKSPVEKGNALKDAALALQGSAYPAFRKFRACESAFEHLRPIKPTPPELGNLLESLQTDFFDALKDTRLPPGDFYAGGMDYERCISGWMDFQQRWEACQVILNEHWSKSEVTYLLTGKFYEDFAWQARGGGWAKDVPQDAWNLFFDRLASAEQNLTKASEIDPKDARQATAMISVAAARSKPEEMERWFQRAMELDPNNYQACKVKLGFLRPRWFGSEEQMLAFGRQCLESTNWGANVPLIMLDAHQYLADDTTGIAYWKSPAVWPDVHAAFEKFFDLNPNALSWRHNYAWYAYHCQQWDVLQKQLELMGPDINYDYFGGFDEFQKMRTLAAEHTARRTSQ